MSVHAIEISHGADASLWSLTDCKTVNFRARTLECAALATLLATGGKSGAVELGGTLTIPAFPNGGDDAWLLKRFGQTWPGLLKSVQAELAACLSSFRTCSNNPNTADLAIVDLATRLASAFGAGAVAEAA